MKHMHLFKKILLSFFPPNALPQGMNPAGMFVSFIHARHFFSLVNRKIIENYKLNGFDIALDPFEVKLGFGDAPSVKLKEVDMYYSYCSAANLNGYRFYSPTTVACGTIMVASQYFVECLEDEERLYQFLLTLYIAHYLFYARIKIFPVGDHKMQFNRFIECLLSLFIYVSQQTKRPLTKKEAEGIKHDILSQADICLALFHHFRHINDHYKSDYLHDKDLYAWLFYDEIKKGEYKKIVEDFMDNIEDYTESTTLSTTEKALFDLVLPADMLMRYLFDADDTHNVARHMLSHIYDRTQLDTLVQGLSEKKESRHDFLSYITDYRLYKKNFLPATQKYVSHVIRTKGDYDHEQEEEINDFMSAVGSGEIENITEADIPKKLKQEGATMERMINFYLTFIGGFWVARGDSGYMRTYKPELLSRLVTAKNLIGNKKASLYYYGGVLYTYSKNIFYYKYAYENIRAGKENFQMPFKSTLREVYSNMYIIKMFNEGFVATLLQDLALEDIKIYVKDAKVLDIFRGLVGDAISSLAQSKDSVLIKKVYFNLTHIANVTETWIPALNETVTDKEKQTLKEHLYSLDFWLASKAYDFLANHSQQLSDMYDESSILGMLATLRDTLLGYLLYKTFLQKQHPEKKELTAMLEHIYVVDVMNVNEERVPVFHDLFVHLQETFSALLEPWGEIEDNQFFFSLGVRNRLHFTNNKTPEDVFTAVMGEDIMWLRGYLKNITYYNRRYIIPKETL